MTKFALTLAATLLAGTALSSAANAGGIRLGFGMPLGSFVAHENQSYSGSGSGYGGRHCDKPSYAARHSQDDDATPVRHAKRAAPRVEVAEAPAPRRVKKAVEDAPVEVKTANLEDKKATGDAAPVIVVPDSPPPSSITGTQATPALVTTASVTSEPAKTPETTVATAVTAPEVKVDAPKVEKIEKVAKDEPKKKIEVSDAKRVCRRFSAAIAGLIEVPCE